MLVPEYRPLSLLLRPSRRYVVTQATDNSVPFYERMGFVRVGAVSAAAKQRGGKGGAEDDGELTPGGGKKRKAAEPVERITRYKKIKARMAKKSTTKKSNVP